MIRSAFLGKQSDYYNYDQGDLPQFQFQTPWKPMRMDEKREIATLIVPSVPSYSAFLLQCDFDPPRLLSGFELADQVEVGVVGHRYSGA